MTQEPQGDAEAVTTGPGGRGAFHEPSVDPWKGLRGIMAGTLVLEAISLALGLTVLARLDSGAHWQWWKIVFVVVLVMAMIVASGMQRRPFAIGLNMTLAVAAVVGWVAHWSIGVVGLLFGVVWIYLLYLRRDLQQRIAGGYLASQYD